MRFFRFNELAEYRLKTPIERFQYLVKLWHAESAVKNSTTLQVIGSYKKADKLDRNGNEYGFFEEVRDLNGDVLFYPFNLGPVRIFTRHRPSLLNAQYWLITVELSSRDYNNPFELSLTRPCLFNIPKSSFKDKIEKELLIKNIFEQTGYTKTDARNEANALRRLMGDLYTETERFIFELLQNADDQPNGNTRIETHLILQEEQLLFTHNGKPFDTDDVTSICSIGDSTKKSDVEKIGYKGIGFKSVFSDSDTVFINSGNFSFAFDKESWYYKDVENIDEVPWQIKPIWAERYKYPKAVQDSDSFFKSPVGIVIGITKEKAEEYSILIPELLNEPRFLLFLRNIDCLSYSDYKGNSYIIRKRRNLSGGFDLLINDQIHSRWITTDYIVDVPQETRDIIENDKLIPAKLKEITKVKISFSALLSDEGHLIPVPEDESILFTYLPTKVNDFKFPFLVNTDFLTTASRETIHYKNHWNIFLFEQIGIKLLDWIISLSQYGGEYLSLIPIIDDDPEDKNPRSILIKAFLDSFKNSVTNAPFILSYSGALLPPSDIIVDKTGLSAIISPDSFCRAIGTSKFLPSSSIETTILEKELFDNIDKVKIKQLASATGITAELNAWYSTASEDSKGSFLTWLDKHSADLSTVIPSLKLFKVGESMCSANELTIESGKLVCTEAIFPIKDILEKLGFSCSECIQSDSNLWAFAPKQPGKKVFEAISAKENLRTLSTAEKLLLVKHLAGFENVGEAAISSMSLFKNINGEIRRMDEMMSFTEDAPAWLNPFIISREENDADIQKYLVPFDSAFEKLVLPKLSSIDVEIKTIYDYFKWSDARISKKVIDLLLTSDKFASFIDVVQDLDKDTREYYLQKDWRLDLSTDEKYTKDSSEYKMLSLAIKTLDDPSVVSSRVFIGDKCLKDYSVKDNVSCAYTSNGISLSIDFSLSRLLPDYENQSGKIEDVKALFESSLAWDKLVKAEQKKADWVEGELNKKLGIVHASYADWVTGAGNAQQYLFSVYRRRLSWATVKGFTIDLAKESNSFVNEIMDFIYAHKLNISTSPFTCKINRYFSGKYFDNDYITTNEQLLPILEQWADNEGKKSFLVNNGVRPVNDDAILFRKAFINDEEFTGFESLSDTDRKEAIEFLVATEIVSWPVTGDNQWKYLEQILDMRYSPLKESIELSELEQKSIEMNLPSYQAWAESNYPRIYLYDGKMPKQINYGTSDIVLVRFYGDDYYYDTAGRKLYVDKNEDVEELLFDLSRGSKVPFNLDDYKAVFRVGMTSVSNEEIEQTQRRIENLTTELSEKEQLLMRYRQRFGDLDESFTTSSQPSDSSGGNVIIKKGNLEGLSISEMAAAQLEAQRFLMQTQPQWHFPDYYGEADEDGELYHYSTAEIIDENGTPTQIVLKSHKAEGEPLKINTIEWTSISRDKARIFVYTGDDIKEIDVKDLVSNQPTVNISFSTENLDIEERISAFADSLHYFKELHFDFDSFNLSKQARSLSGMYNVNDRRQGATSDSDL